MTTPLLIQKIFKHFDTPPEGILVENLRFYVVSNTAQTLAWITHACWMLIFFYLDVAPLTYIQPISIAAYILAINLNRRSYHLLSMVVSIVEIVAHQIYATRLLGADTGFQYFIPVVAIFPFLIPRGFIVWKWALLFFCSLGYLYIEFYIRPQQPVFIINQHIKTIFNVLNILISFGMFATWAIYLTVAINKSQIILDKERKLVTEAEKAAALAEVNKELALKERDKEIFQLRNIELKKSYEDLKAAQTQLIQQEKMASLGQVTAGVAHEINNPINFVSSGISSLKKDFEDLTTLLQLFDKKFGSDAEIHDLKKQIDYEFTLNEINELFETIKNGANRTAEIVKGLRTFSRLDHSTLQWANINSLIEQTVLELSSKYKEKIDFEISLAELPLIKCNPNQLSQVWSNIIMNSIQAIENKGQVEISTCIKAETIFVKIKDNGTGIPNHIIDKIFDPFFTTKPIGNGVGLGLSTAFGIIVGYQGNITVSSQVGVGSTFEISIPLTDEKL